MTIILEDDLFKPFIVYRSSAGSGKTYTLALEYLKLALKEGTSFRNILAVTFTNKATQEMKSRIIEFLYQLSVGQGEGIREVLRESTGLNDKNLTLSAGSVLSRILHGYSFFAVMTIDAFFQKVVRAFAREMGLQAGFRLEMDTGRVLDEVIDQILLGVGKEENNTLTQWLVEFALEKVEQGHSWDFRRDIKHLASQLFKEEYKTKEAQLLEADGRKLKVAEVLKMLKETVTRFENKMQQIGEEAVAIMQEHGLEVNDFAFNTAGVMGYLNNLAERKFYPPGKRALNAIDNPEAWYSKKSEKKDDIQVAVENGLQDALSRVVALCHTDYETYLSTLQPLRFVYTYGILADVNQKLEQYKLDHDFMLISDAPLFLKEIIGQDETPFIYEKIGTTFNHFLIDEFQDTSGFQWDNFRPLVENSLDAGYQNLIVGDIKQSIYRWRGGDWRLLLEQIQQDISPAQTLVKNLDKNYRSLKQVIDFNNSLFATLPSLFEEELQAKIAEIENPDLQDQLLWKTTIISDAYADAYQYLPEAKREDASGKWQGHVHIELSLKERRNRVRYETEEEEPDYKTKILERIPPMIEDLQERGYQPQDIAFLVRRKEDGREIANALMLYKSEKAKPGYSYEVVSSESLFLENSLTVTFLVDLLKFLNNPADNVARAGVLFKYHRLKNEADLSPEQLHDIFMAASGKRQQEGLRPFFAMLPKDFINNRPYLNKLPLYELVEHLIRIFRLGESSEIAYLQAFQDAVLEFTDNEAGDIYSFLEWWKDKGREYSVQISEQMNAMRILTIHKSKGLQFKVVIIPFCDWKLDHAPTSTNILWLQSDQKPLSEVGLMPLRYSSRLKDTVYRQDYYDEMIRTHIDNLNLLYVAFTRAEECLYAFAQTEIAKSGECKLHSVANALYLTFNRELPEETNPHHPLIALCKYWDPARHVLELGTPPTLEAREQFRKDKTENNRVETVILHQYPSHPWRNKVTVKQKAKGYFMKATEGGAIRINYGALLYDVLTRMETSDDLERIVEEVYFERGISSEEKEELMARARQLMQNDEVAAWYKGAYEQIKTNISILTKEGLENHPGRVLIMGKQAVVIDFKIGKKSKAVVKSDARQVRSYMKLLQKMGYQPVEGYLLYINKVEIEKV